MRHLHQTGKISLAALTLACCQYAAADTVFGIYAGAGSWQSDYSGSAGDPQVSADELGMKDNNNTFYYIAIEHPVPFLPNLKVQQNNITSDQTGTIKNSFSIDDVIFPAGTNVKTDFDLSSTDATLYYEFLDNWLNLDLGVTLRKYSGHLKAEAMTLRDEIDIDATVPLIYGKFQFDLPLTGFSAGVEGNFISYDGNNLHDYNAKISYMFDSALDLGLEVGYRTMKIDINEDDVSTNLELKGPYAAAVFHF
ncbi:MAG TPA: TIGR04219 family outer membrane beta-barrel protein [Cellvibrio sp.]